MSRLAIIVEFDLKAGEREAFAEVIRDHAAGSLAEDGCERFDVLLPRDDERRAFCFEIWRDDERRAFSYAVWRDDAALKNHIEAARMETFRTRRVPLIDGFRATVCDFG